MRDLNRENERNEEVQDDQRLREDEEFLEGVQGGDFGPFPDAD